MSTRDNMVAAATDAKGVLAMLTRRPTALQDATDNDLRLISQSLSTLVGTIDAHLEQRSAEPTDMAREDS